MPDEIAYSTPIQMTTIQLPDDMAQTISEVAEQVHLTRDQLVENLVRICLIGDGPKLAELRQSENKDTALIRLLLQASRLVTVDVPDAITSSQGVVGGDARIRNTRIPVWLVVAHKKWGESDSEILAQYPGLNAADLSAAWDYYTVNSERVDSERRAHEEAD